MLSFTIWSSAWFHQPSFLRAPLQTMWAAGPVVLLPVCHRAVHSPTVQDWYAARTHHTHSTGPRLVPTASTGSAH